MLLRLVRHRAEVERQHCRQVVAPVAHGTGLGDQGVSLQALLETMLAR